MRFQDFVCFEGTVSELETAERDAAIEALVSALAEAGRIPEKSAPEIARAVIDRENEASTGMGKGVAIPHVKHAAVKSVVAAVGQSDAGIDFKALDEQPVYVVILLISPASNPDNHLQAMELVFKHLQKEKFRKFLRQCRTRERLEDLLTEADENPSW
ncbi:MAG: PTS sugar transporter subunit IIA [Sedimentisphaerales bacterium]|nr:PTS sugar transporter subunit IIA [Sedimentisphaerales bacterium]